MAEELIIRNYPYRGAPISDVYLDGNEVIVHSRQSKRDIKLMAERISHIKDQKPNYDDLGLTAQIPLVFLVQWWKEWTEHYHEYRSWEDHQILKMNESSMEPWRVHKEVVGGGGTGQGNNWLPAPKIVRPKGLIRPSGLVTEKEIAGL